MTKLTSASRSATSGSGDYVESVATAGMSPVALAAAPSPLPVTASLGGRGLFGVELFVTGDMVWFSEVSPRPHDTGLVAGVAALLGIRTARRAVLGLPATIPHCASRVPLAVIYGGMGSAHQFTGWKCWRLRRPGLFGTPESLRQTSHGVAVANGGRPISRGNASWRRARSSSSGLARAAPSIPRTPGALPAYI